jgi:hypothetical protein
MIRASMNQAHDTEASMKNATIVGLTLCVVVAVGSTSAQTGFEPVYVMPFGDPNEVAVAGDIVIYGITSGLLLVDPANPAAPETVARLALPADVSGIAVDRELAYVAGAESGVFIVDISTPSDPALIQFLPTPGSANAVAVRGDFVFVADGDEGFRVIRRTPGFGKPNVVDVPGAREVSISGDRAAVAGSDLVKVVDISTPQHMVGLGQVEIEATAVAMDGDLLFIATDSDGLRVYDISQPADPIWIGLWVTANQLRDLALVDGDAWLVERGNSPPFGGLRLIDLSDPAHPFEVASIDLQQDVGEVAVADGRAFVVNHYRGDRFSPIVDVADPMSLRQVGAVAAGSAGFLLAEDDLVLVGDGSYYAGRVYFGVIEIVDLAVPEAPRSLGAIAVPEIGEAVAVDDATVVIVDSLEQLHIYDISTPSMPASVGVHQVQLCGTVRGAAVAGESVFVTDRCGLRVFDVSDPAAPDEIGFLEPDAWDWWSPWMAGEYVYLATYGYWGGGSILIIDVSDPSDPFEAGWSGLGLPLDFSVFEDRAYVLTHGGSVMGGCWVMAEIAEISDPSVPVMEGQWFLGASGNCAGQPWGTGAAPGGTFVGFFQVDGEPRQTVVINPEDSPDPRPIDLGLGWIDHLEAVGDRLLASNWYGLTVFVPSSNDPSSTRDE